MLYLMGTRKIGIFPAGAVRLLRQFQYLISLRSSRLCGE
jgi:hypothetical protein